MQIAILSIAGGAVLSTPSVANSTANSQTSNLVDSDLPSLNQQTNGGEVLPVPDEFSSTDANRISTLGSVVARRPLPLSPGDRLRISIPGIGAEDFNGVYEVNLSGDLELPYVAPLTAVGYTPEALEQQVESTLINQQIFRPGLLKVSVQVLDYSPVQVSVTGDVFEPGRLLVAGDEETPEADGEAINISGDYPVERYLTSTLLAAGGVQPTADISQVQILRGTQSTVVDLSGILTGDVVEDIPLIAGDQVIVPSKGVFQKSLVRPTQITPQTVELYVSNITEPGGNSLESSDDINTASFEYGTNLVQALVASECIGGSRSTNADRRALLIQTDTISGELNTDEYSVQTLISQATESPDETPLLMPNDAIACYDSSIVNTRNLFDTIGDFLRPINLLRNIFF